MKGYSMHKAGGTAAVIAACLLLAGCDEETEADPAPNSAPVSQAAFTGAKKITVDGKSVNVSCSGTLEKGKPVVVLLHGGGDALDKFASLQETLGKKNRVCSYDRLGAGGSDQPADRQTFETTGKVLTGVLGQLAADSPVVLAGHSLGGLIAARYAPDHQDKVKGLVLMDATSPTQGADLTREIPADATGDAADLRAQTLAVFNGESPEKLVVSDADVKSAGDIPVEVIKHGKEYLAQLPQYGPGLERAWTEGQVKWLALSSRSELTVAKNSGHYIYQDQPDVAVREIEDVAARVAG
ncbi:alpha/beta fold hydrolase [Amycolatopsis sp. A1MSW2902]|uniref:alpha/beta fold hydrolase n=1 Tax=Amycolatopsis sp. A1MSW2902 TaxID=687413 RepID=UPI00307DF9CC